MSEFKEGTEYFQVSGDSMWPLLREEDRVLSQRVAICDLRSGDIVVYRDAGKVICHRFLRCGTEGGKLILVCRADTAHRCFFERIAEESYIGKIRAVVRGEKIFPLKRGLFAWHGWNRWIAPLCVVLVKVKNLFR